MLQFPMDINEVQDQIDFYLKGKMLQREIYNDIEGSLGLNPVLFDSTQIDEWHWYGKKD